MPEEPNDHDRVSRPTEPDAHEQAGSERDLPLDAGEQDPDVEPFQTDEHRPDDAGTGHGYGYE